METTSPRNSGCIVTSSASQAAPARTPARTAEPADGGRTGTAPGAPASNTAPYNCIGGSFKALRWGVDSLYLSYRGEIFPDVLSRLKALKARAQSQEDCEVAQAQYPLDGHVFEVKDKGAALFPYILEDGAFRIQLCKGGKVPMAYVKVSAGLLAHVSPEEAEKRLYALLVQLGDLRSPAQVSRIDLFLDFSWSGSMEWDRSSWITRAASIDTYSENGIFTGWVVGKGGHMLARLYLKTLQAKKIGADYLLGLWKECGWQEDDPVWRLEFQVKREILAEMGIPELARTLENRNGLWSYATTEWLKLAIPQEGDKTRSRWPIHPLWQCLSSIDWDSPGGPLLRQHALSRGPDLKKTYAFFLSALTTYMAANAIEDVSEGHKAMVKEAMAHFAEKAEIMRKQSLADFIGDKVALKVRQFNTGANVPLGLTILDQDELAKRAETYRKATGG